MTLALTGGTGFVGGAVLHEADRRGLAVRALTRRPQTAREGVEWVGGDLADVAALERLVAGAGAVLHVAGIVSAGRRELFEEGNVRGTERLVAASRGAGVRRFVLVSSLAAREPALSDYGWSKRAAERVVEESGLDWTIVRPPLVYGPRDTEVLQLFRAAKWGVVPVPPAGHTSVIEAGDLARLLLDLAAGGPQVTGRVFEPDDGRAEGWPHAEFARAIGRALGRRVLAPGIPAALFGPAARIDRLLRGDGAKLTPDRARYMVHPDWVAAPARRVPEALWRPLMDTHEGLARTARWYREQGWL